MSYFGISMWAVAGVVLLVAAWQARCLFGFHPRDELRMLSGEMVKRRNTRGDVIDMTSVAQWECNRCLRIVGVTAVRPDVALAAALRKQVPEAREKSKVLKFDVVERKDGAA